MNKFSITTLSILCFLFICSFSINGQIFINEFLASNDSGITDETGDFEDWIEIYNAGSSDLNLTNYYISDDPLEPLLWQIPTGRDPSLTTVPAGGYLILWADKDTEDGPNHIDLKLGAGGEAIILTAPDGMTVVDQIVFDAQTADVSNGRATDGAPNLVFFPSPTPGMANIPGGVPTYTVNLEVSLVSGNDDAEQESFGNVILNSSDIEMVENFGNSTTAGFRFSNINLPSDAVVTNAYLQFVAEEIQIGPANLIIHGESSGNSAPFQMLNQNITNRVTTNNATNWIPEPWFIIGANGTDQQSPDLSEIINEMIALPDWDSGNTMAFIISGSGTRTTYSFEQNPLLAAKLVIEAEIPLSTDPIPTVYINEIASNSTTYRDENGTKEDWIELYNPNLEPVDLSGLFLTDKFSDLDKWQIPPGTIIPAEGYLTFFTDNDEEDGPLHTNFSLKSGGEEIALSQLLTDGLSVIDSVTFGAIPFMATFGREIDGGDNFILFGDITPEATNNGAGLYLPSPSFSVESGAYQSTQIVSINSTVSGTNIFYTTDGSTPTNSSAFYNGPIEVSETSSLRAIARKNDYADSQPSDATYLINENKNLPILYITTDPDNFFDDEIGIYVDGTNGVQAYCAPMPVNWAQDWERPINLKMFLPDGELAFDVEAGVEINGACSRNRAMKSLGINLRDKEFGDEAIEYPLFAERDHDNYQRLKLRNSGQDFRRLGFRDMVNQNILTGKLDLDLQAGRPSLLYLNGEFWGIYNIREKFAGEYFEAIYDVDEDDLDIIKSPGLPWSNEKQGTEDIYDALFQVVENSNFTDDIQWDYFESQVDVNEMMNYWITMTYMNNYDWPANNLTVWRERKEGAKWRYGMADTDGSTQNNLTSGGVAEPEFNKFSVINDPNITTWPNHSNSTLFLRKSLERETFRNEFIQRSCSVIELVYNSTRVNSFIDDAVAQFEPNVQEHIDRWGFDNAMGGSTFSWYDWIDLYRDFYNRRPSFWRAHLDGYYNLDGYYDLTVNFDSDSGGDVFVNTNEMEIPYNYVGTYFKNIPLRLTAVAKPGYVFQYWLETGNTNPEIDFIGNANTILTPIFELTDCTEIIPGTACDDEDACTINDVYDTDCNCAGTFEDTDLDGVCDAEDQCIGFDDTIDENGNGIPDDCEECIDMDGDLVCAEDDCDDLNPNIPATPGSNCNDRNPLTINDIILEDGCTCAGSPLPPMEEYCESAGEAPWHEWIARVELFDLSNDSGKSTYSDFTNLSANLSQGEDYTLSLTTGFSWESFDEYYRVWIDYNQNNIFDEPEEIAYSGTLSGTPNGTPFADLIGTISIPADAIAGTTRMRVSMQRGEFPNPCGNFQLGEVEDYSINIAESGPTLSINNCPTNIVVEVLAGQTSEPIFWDAPTASTTCIPNTISLVQTTGMPSGSTFDPGTTTITYRATDECENVEFCTFTVTVKELNPGSILFNCQPDIVVTAAAGATGINITWNEPTGTTTCPANNLIVTQTGGPVSGSFFPIGFYQILYNATDDCGNEAFCFFDISVLPGENNEEYCLSEGDFPWHDWIANVQLNSLNNASLKSNYTDFTNQSTNLNLGVSYDFIGITNFSYYTFDEYWKVWIDYNQDGIFSEISEVAFSGTLDAPPNGTLSATINGTITIPGNAPTGLTRMRIAMKRGAEPGPCEIFGFGEVEDYSVNLTDFQAANRTVSNTIKTIKDPSDKVKVYPNPVASILNLELDKDDQLQQIEIFDITGKKLHTIIGKDEENRFQFNVTDWSKGLYIFHIRLIEGRSVTKRVFVNSKF